jgi:hypothetical protein
MNSTAGALVNATAKSREERLISKQAVDMLGEVEGFGLFV